MDDENDNDCRGDDNQCKYKDKCVQDMTTTAAAEVVVVGAAGTMTT